MSKRIMCFILLTVWNQICSARSTDDLIRQTLMASHIPQRMMSQFPQLVDLTYIKGHDLYDTTVELIDDQGLQIKYLEQL